MGRRRTRSSHGTRRSRWHHPWRCSQSFCQVHTFRWTFAWSPSPSDILVVQAAQAATAAGRCRPACRAGVKACRTGRESCRAGSTCSGERLPSLFLESEIRSWTGSEYARATWVRRARAAAVACRCNGTCCVIGQPECRGHHQDQQGHLPSQGVPATRAGGFLFLVAAGPRRGAGPGPRALRPARRTRVTHICWVIKS